MKRRFITIITLLAIYTILMVLSSCTQKTCPTYANQKVEEVNQDLDSNC